MNNETVVKRTGIGVMAGLAGTFAMQGLLTAGQKWLPEAQPPYRQAPGTYMVEKAEEALPPPAREQVPEVAEKAAEQSLAVGYGVLPGALYALLRPEGGNVVMDGALLGFGVWAAGYLGWLPALGLLPPVHRQQPKKVLLPIVQHVLYGIVTTAAFNWLLDRD